MKLIKKYIKSPDCSFKKNNNIPLSKTESKCYSITIRTGNGLDLGSIAVTRLIDYLSSISKEYVLVSEMEFEKQHIQGGVFFDSLKRQDNLRASLLPMVVDIWRDQQVQLGYEITPRGEEAVKKHALMIVPHNHWRTLINYCYKGFNYDAIILKSNISREIQEQCTKFYFEYNYIRRMREQWLRQQPDRLYLLNHEVIYNHTVASLLKRYPNERWDAFR